MEEIGKKLSKLYTFPMSTMIYLDINARQERQLFSDINKLPRKIGGNLAVLREQRRFYHVLATRLVEESPIMKRIPVDMFTERGKGPEFFVLVPFADRNLDRIVRGQAEIGFAGQWLLL